MSDDSPARYSSAKRIAGILLAVIAFNLLLRSVPLPDIDLPSLSIGGAPDWLHTVLEIKNWLLLGILAVIVIGVVTDQVAKERDAQRGED